LFLEAMDIINVLDIEEELDRRIVGGTRYEWFALGSIPRDMVVEIHTQ